MLRTSKFPRVKRLNLARINTTITIPLNNLCNNKMNSTNNPIDLTKLTRLKTAYLTFFDFAMIKYNALY